MDVATPETEFWKQFAGSGSANLLTIVALGLLWGLKKLCSRKTKCKSHLHTCCLDIDERDETQHEAPNLADGRTASSV